MPYLLVLTPISREVHDDLAKHFSEKEIAEIAAIVINMNLWTRLKLAQGETPYIG